MADRSQSKAVALETKKDSCRLYNETSAFRSLLAGRVDLCRVLLREVHIRGTVDRDSRSYSLSFGVTWQEGLLLDQTRVNNLLLSLSEYIERQSPEGIYMPL